MKKFLNIKTFAFIAFVAIAAAIVYANFAANKANEGVEVKQHIKGNPDAAVMLTEYSDFQCPACGQFYPVVKELLETYPNDLALEYKHFPLISVHPFAVPAAKAAEAAGQQDKFFEMHDKLFENQQVWSRAANPRAFFTQYAEELGLDVDQFNRHYGASVLKEKIEDEFAQARELGLTGTPSFFLNGERLQFETFEEFTTAIETAINADKNSSGTSTEAVSEPGSSVRFGF